MIVRPDLPKGLLAAQVVHAAGESSPGQLPSGTYAVVLACKDLTELATRLSVARVEHTTITENDGPFAGQKTAIGVRPNRRSKLKKHFSSLKLLQ